MERNGWQKTWVRIVTTAMTVAVMALIFVFSTEDAERSDETSGSVSRTIIQITCPDYDMMAPKDQRVYFDSIQHLVRKSAHFSEYTALGFMIRLCLESWFGHRMKKYRILALIGFAAGTVYACTDEAHQLAIDGRSGQFTDVLVDGSGVLAGVVLGTLLIRSLNRKLPGSPDGTKAQE